MTTVNPSDLTAEHFTRVIKAQPSDSINGMECNGEKHLTTLSVIVSEQTKVDENYVPIMFMQPHAKSQKR